MFLDIGAAIFFAIGVANIFHEPLTFPAIVWSVFFALITDFDGIIELIARKGMLGGNEIGAHREVTHFPITYIPIMAAIFFFCGPFWGTLFSANVLFHFLHDSVGIGWGIKWLWPFKKDSYKFFATKENKMSGRFLVSWAPGELEHAVAEYGERDWFKKYYLRPSALSLIEAGVFLAALVTLLLRSAR